MFFRGSRYANVPEHEIADATGRTTRYKKIRFISRTKAVRTHTVTQGERLDNIAFRHLRDPERFWRICDANLSLWPDDLLAEPGDRILIPKSED